MPPRPARRAGCLTCRGGAVCAGHPGPGWLVLEQLARLGYSDHLRPEGDHRGIGELLHGAAITSVPGVRDRVLAGDSSSLFFLPLSHILARVVALAAFARWKQRQGQPAGATVADLRTDPELRAVVQQAVDRANTQVSRAEGIKRFRILPGRFEVGVELTPTQKVRRDYVLATCASDIAALYA